MNLTGLCDNPTFQQAETFLRQTNQLAAKHIYSVVQCDQIPKTLMVANVIFANCPDVWKCQAHLMAAKWGKTKWLEFLEQKYRFSGKRLSLSDADSKNQTAYHLAADGKGTLKLFEYLYGFMPGPLSVATKDGLTALYLATLTGKEDVVEWLLKSGCEDMKALDAAAKKGSASIFALLAHKHPDANYLQIANMTQNIEIMKMCMTMINPDQDPIIVAVGKLEEDIALALLVAAEKPQYSMILKTAVQYGLEKIVKHILWAQNDPPDPSLIDLTMSANIKKLIYKRLTYTQAFTYRCKNFAGMFSQWHV